MLKRYLSYLYENTAKDSCTGLCSLLERNENAALLDCGCWDGVNTKKFGNIVGTSSLHGMEINRLKANKALKNGVKAKICDLNKRFPYKGNYFDVIIANHVIEHLVNVKLFMSEIYRVLKSGGYAIICTPNLASWHNIFALLIGHQPFSGPTIEPDYESDVSLVREINKERLGRVFSGDKSKDLDHIKVMTAKALVGLLKKCRYKIESIKGFGYYPFPPMIAKPLSRIDPYHSHYIIAKARK